MRFNRLHPWRVSFKRAIEIQNLLQPKIKLMPLAHSIKTVAGADVCFSKIKDTVWGGIAVFSYPELMKLEEKWARGKSEFPYIPGLLSFREIPILLKALEQTRIHPDVILCDGQGIAHPRGLGLATHLGLVLDSPTIGCAKSLLVGEFGALGEEKGSQVPLLYEGHRVGSVVRTRTAKKPIYVSPGSKITFEESVHIGLRCCKKYRVPEPIRAAHMLVTSRRKQEEGRCPL